MNEQETQVNEQPTEEQVDLSGVEIVSNGEVVDTSTPETKTEEPETVEQEEDNNKELQQLKVETIQEDVELENAAKEQEQAKSELATKGVDYEKLEKEYNSTGQLSEDSYKELEKAGYPKAVVNAIIAGWQSKADAFVNKVVENAGGKREFQRVQKFVSEQGKAAIEAFNQIVENADLNTISVYMAGIKAQMTAKYGTNNPTLAGGNAPSGVSGYEDTNEMVRAMSDPRYGKDAKYTKQVEEKVAKSTFF